jgi:Helicase conserved C-terminal domain/Type III restriction enzyme, res subunit
MNPLESVLDKLKVKPVIQERQEVKVILKQPEEIIVTGPEKTIIPKIVDRTKEGFDRNAVLDKLKQNNLLKVRQPAAAIVDTQLETKSVAKPVSLPTAKKLGQTKLVLQPETETTLVEEDILRSIPIQTKRLTPKVPRTKVTGVSNLKTTQLTQIGDVSMRDRVKPVEPVSLKVSSYYMNNREVFVNFINQLFEPYKRQMLEDTSDINCDNIGNTSVNMDLLTHQKIVRDYINLYTPYRGLLIYHGLGSGKTCTSIAIAEGMKSAKRVIVMTPASLRRNYLEEIKKCGDPLFRKNQYWEFISLDTTPNMLETLSSVLGLPVEYIRRNRGAWLVDMSKPANFSSLSTSDKKSIDTQLDKMIENKYTFINYNGLREREFKQLTQNYEVNIFENAVVIIDEAHNLISRIVNKINSISKFNEAERGPGKRMLPGISLQIYEMLLRADRARVILLTGTPLINYPNELGILFNILRGYIKSWQLTLSSESSEKLDLQRIRDIFSKEKNVDYVDYTPSSKMLTITRNPYGFESVITENSGYKGVTNQKKVKLGPDKKPLLDDEGKPIMDERGTISDEDFLRRVIKLLKNNNIEAVPLGSYMKVNTALPDTLEEFKSMFIEDDGRIKNLEKFKRRIIGLTSYFRSAQEELLPKFNKEEDYHIVKCPMSNYQFKEYENIRIEERLSEKPSKKGAEEMSSSTYRIFSRLACNFVMPVDIGRPTPKGIKASRKSAAEKKEKEAEMLGGAEGDEEPLEQAQAQPLEQAQAQPLKQGQAQPLEQPQAEPLEEAQAEPLEEDIPLPPPKKTKKQVKIKSTPMIVQEDIVEEEQVQPASVIPPLEKIVENVEERLEQQDEKPVLQGIKDEDAKNRDINELEGDEMLEVSADREYIEKIQQALEMLRRNASTILTPNGLQTYSPKFLHMLENIRDPENPNEHPGLHLIYSQFRSMEGIQIFTMVLDTNGFSRFKIKKDGTSGWQLDMAEEDLGKPTYALYTGTEDAEEREIIRNIYNGDWDYIPTNIANQLRAKANNNNMGEIIKVLMITSAGSEGINLKNTRYVHIMEPYWNPVRVEQVIGRARRICSHKNLPEALRNVEVFVYVATLTKEQLASKEATELRVKDLSKLPPFVPQTTDEKLLEISLIKERVASQLSKGIKEAAIDCATHVKSSINEKLQCLSFGPNPAITEFSYNPNLSQDENDMVSTLNKAEVTWKGKQFTYKGTPYVIREETEEVYDLESYKNSLKDKRLQPVLLGKFENVVGIAYQKYKDLMEKRKSEKK